MERILEPEVMDNLAEAREYDAMDFTEVNRAFAKRVIELAPHKATVLDLGTGTARIPIIMAQQCPQWQITGLDLAQSMLEIGRKNVIQAGLETQINLQLGDAKNINYAAHSFDVVVSNSLVHHLPNPLPFFAEIKRVVKPQGVIFIRDLLRPAGEDILEEMVKEVSSDYSHHQTQLFRDSLAAAFTLNEVEHLLVQAGLNHLQVYQSSPRHWTAETVN